MALLKSTPVSTDRFTWLPGERLFVAEASDLPEMSRVFDDACDVGYCLVSAKTQKCMVVAVDDEIRDSENELVCWVLRPVARAKRNLFAVRVYND